MGRAKNVGWLLLALVCGYYLFQSKVAPVLFTPLRVLDHHVELVQDGKQQEAYALMSASYRAQHDVKEFTADVARLAAVYTSSDRSQYAIGRRGRKEAYETGVYQVICEVPHGSSIWTVEFVQDADGEQRIQSIERWEKQKKR
jgi:hypothetical protein